MLAGGDTKSKTGDKTLNFLPIDCTIVGADEYGGGYVEGHGSRRLRGNRAKTSTNAKVSRRCDVSTTDIAQPHRPARIAPIVVQY